MAIGVSADCATSRLGLCPPTRRTRKSSSRLAHVHAFGDGIEGLRRYAATLARI